jgi:hypothetical protein
LPTSLQETADVFTAPRRRRSTSRACAESGRAWDDGVKAAEECVVEQRLVIGHRDDQAFRLGVIEEREKRVEDAAGVHDVKLKHGHLPSPDGIEVVK